MRISTLPTSASSLSSELAVVAIVEYYQDKNNVEVYIWEGNGLKRGVRGLSAPAGQADVDGVDTGVPLG